MLIGLLTNRMAAKPEDAAIATGVVDRIDDGTIASFVARVGQRPSAARRIDWRRPSRPWCRTTTARDRCSTWPATEAEQTEFGADPRFPRLWQSAVTTCSNYSDKSFVSAEYARELSAARTQAIEVERLSDDPPERIAAWLASVSERAPARPRPAADARPDARRDRPGQLGGVADAGGARDRTPRRCSATSPARSSWHDGHRRQRHRTGRRRCATRRSAALDTLARGALVAPRRRAPAQGQRRRAWRRSPGCARRSGRVWCGRSPRRSPPRTTPTPSGASASC